VRIVRLGHNCHKFSCGHSYERGMVAFRPGAGALRRDLARMTVLLTGAAGFIGFHTATALLARGQRVIGIDNLNAYYDVELKRARLGLLEGRPGFSFHKLDVSDRDGILGLFARHPETSIVVHLAAQAGVRYSLVDPFAYITANVVGHTVILESARRLPALRNLVYASSSSVYGANDRLPFAVGDRVDSPNSLYAATKRSDELISHTYAHLYRLPQTGLRFFTVYGPWGRPDMAAYIFAKKIAAGESISVFNSGEMWRDFTYIDDVVQGILAAIDRPPTGFPHRLYNLGNNRSEKLTDFIAEIERALGKRAIVQLEAMQKGDVERTYADIEESRRDLGFQPSTTIAEGIPRFIDWFRDYHRLG
jgi:UDP-glucuronate 4-epimerase